MAVLALVVAAAGSALGCRGPEGAELAAEVVPPNIVLLLVDTLRADHLSAYGYSRPTSPNLDGLAAGGILFAEARSQAACTFPSANSILTSRYPVHFLDQPDDALGIPEGTSSVAEILAARGYATVALSASPIVCDTPSDINPHGGFGRGFDVFNEACEWGSALCLHRELADLLPRLVPPYFLFIHYMEPHGPYRPPESYRRRFAGDYEGPEFVRLGDPRPIETRIYQEGRDPGVSAGDLGHLVDLYDDEIRFFDEQLDVLLRMLRQGGLLADTLFALVADHGEAFLEHEDIKHCRTPYDTQVKTPLVLRVPGGPAGLRIDAAVENLDVVPTLLDYAGVDLSPFAFEGESLRPLIEARLAGGEAPGGHYAFSSQGIWRSVTDGRHKLLYHLPRRTFELYDLAVDPGETRDVRDEEPEAFQRLRRALYGWLLEVEGGTSSKASVEAAREVERRLKALGYLQ